MFECEYNECKAKLNELFYTDAPIRPHKAKLFVNDVMCFKQNSLRSDAILIGVAKEFYEFRKFNQINLPFRVMVEPLLM